MSALGTFLGVSAIFWSVVAFGLSAYALEYREEHGGAWRALGMPGRIWLALSLCAAIASLWFCLTIR